MPACSRRRGAALKPGGRLVANAVSLGSEARLIELFQRHGGSCVRLEIAKSRQGRQRQRLRLAAGRADHPMAGDQAMIVAGVGCRRERLGRRDREGRAHGAWHVPAAGRASRRGRDRIGEGDRAGLRGSRAAAVGELVACTIDDLDRGRGPGADAVQAGARSQGRAVDRRGLGAGRRRPQRRGCSARASRRRARPAPSPMGDGR